MQLDVVEITSFEDFLDVVGVEWEAYSNPPNAFWEVFKGPTLRECASRQWYWHTATPESHWIKVVDTDTGEILGATEWIVQRGNPYETPGPELECTWWPKGDSRYAVMNEMFKPFLSVRMQEMNKPHIMINHCFVSQRYRRRGVAKLMMRWGLMKADEMSLECFVEATEDGIPLYAASGFQTLTRFNLTTGRDRKTHKETLGPSFDEEYQPILCMYRPRNVPLKSAQFTMEAVLDAYTHMNARVLKDADDGKK